MCLITKDKTYKIADKKIECYKILRYDYPDKFLTPYQFVPIDITKNYIKSDKFDLVPERITRFYIQYDAIKHGIHACCKDALARYKLECFLNHNPDHKRQYVIFKMYVPIGIKYWIGLNGDIVAELLNFDETNKQKIIKQIKLKYEKVTESMCCHSSVRNDNDCDGTKLS